MEIWKSIEGTNGRYEVSNTGKIRSLNYLGHKGVVKVIAPALDNKGYERIRIYYGDYRKTVKVHRAVAEAFIPNPENKPQVNHKNGVKTDNRVENLEWTTAHDNIVHAYKSGLKEKNRKFAKKLGKSQVKNLRKYTELQKTPITATNIETGEVVRFDSQTEASEFCKVPQPNIHKVVKGLRKSAGGYTFVYSQGGGANE